MQTSKYEIGANLQGLEFRRQANEILAALASSNAGDLEPAAAQAGTVWLDTSNNKKHLLKIRNKANSAWGILCSIDAQSGVVDTIDAYTKRESDDKFVLKTDLNQTLQNVKSQRQAGEIYTNNTGKPIFISVVCQANNQGGTYEMWLEINGIAVQKVYGGAVSALTPKASICGVIPAGATYKITTYNNIGSTIITDWAELR